MKSTLVNRSSRFLLSLRDYYKYRYLTLLLLPGLVYYLVFHYAPMYGIQLDFKDFIVRKGIWKSPWVGLYYFRILFKYPSFWEVFRNTIIISVYKISVGFCTPIIIANTAAKRINEYGIW